MSMANDPEKSIKEYLLKKSLLSAEEYDKANGLRKEKGTYLFKEMVELGLVDDSDLAQWVSSYHRLPCLSLDNYKFDTRIANLIPQKTAEEYGVMVLDNIADMLTVVFAGWPGKEEIDRISEITSCRISVLVTSVSEMERNMFRAYHPEGLASGFVEKVVDRDSFIKTLRYRGLERRNYRRYNKSVKFRYEFSEKRMVSISVNISFKGMLLRSDKPIELSSHIIGRLDLPSDYREIICVAQVVRTERISSTDEYYVALDFKSIDTDDSNRLRDYLYDLEMAG